MSPQRTEEILVILTSTHDLPSHPNTRDATALGITDEEARRTGFDVKEVAYLYECLSREVRLKFASPRGGHCTIDPLSMKSSENDETVRKFLKCQEAMDMIKNTESLDRVNPSDYWAVVFPGGPGTLFDLPNNPKVNEIVQLVWVKSGWLRACP